MVRALSNDLRERVVSAVLAAKAVAGGIAVWRCSIVGGEVVAAVSRDRLGEARQDGVGTASRCSTRIGPSSWNASSGRRI
jgi:hypothetical protein